MGGNISDYLRLSSKLSSVSSRGILWARLSQLNPAFLIYTRHYVPISAALYTLQARGGKGATRGNILFIKVIKSRKWKKNARNIILFRCSKALYLHTFSKMFLSKCTLKNIYNTPQICSGMLKIAPKALHFQKFLRGGPPNPPPPPPEERAITPPPPSVPSLRHLTPFIIPQETILATFIVSLLVYISQMYLLV